MVTFPNGGENLIIGNTYNVEWNFEGIADSLTLSLQRIGPGDIQYSTRVKNDGNHPLTIPNVATDFPYKVILESEFGSFRDFSDNEFNIVSSGGSNTYGGDVSRTIDYTVSEFEIEVGDGVGAINDIDVNISLSGTHPDHLRYIELYLVSPQGTRIFLFGGDQMPQGGGYSSNTNTFVNTSFNDSAQKSIYSGTTPFIGDHRPDQSLSQLLGEDKFGIWKVVLAHSDWTVESGHTIDVSHVSIDIDSETYSGSIYDETNNWVTTTTNTSPGGVGPSGSYNVLINSSPGSSGGVIDDIDVEVSLRGDHPII